MIDANSRIFRGLDSFCALRSDALGNAGTKRWISTDNFGKRFLKHAEVVESISLAPNIKMVHYSLDTHSYIVVSGLEMDEAPAHFSMDSLEGGALTLFLAEENLSPAATPAEIRNIVEFDDGTTNPDFSGFDVKDIASLFPVIQIFSTEQLAPGESFRSFFLLALYSKLAIQVRDEQLVKEVRALAEINPQAIPYRTLCRAVLDSDPSSLFLALYRCIEALYAYSHAQTLKAKLKLELPWSELASTLEDVLQWHPREEQSLAHTLTYADVHKLTDLASAFDQPIPEDGAIASIVAKQVYGLRNAVVHYRPFQQSSEQEIWDWNRIVGSMTVLVFDIYDAVLSNRAPNTPKKKQAESTPLEIRD